MSQLRATKLGDYESHSYDFLWRAANELGRVSPAVSRHLAGALVSAVPEDGISAFAKRMHCRKCGALMTWCKTRVRPSGRRARIAGASCRNIVLRTCAACGEVNREPGVPRGVRVGMGNGGDVEEVRSLVERAAEKNQAASISERTTPVTKVIVKSRSKMGKKKNKRKSLDKRAASGGRDGKRSGLATSFLFDPL